MTERPTCEELEKRIRELEKESTDHKRTVEALRNSEEQHRALFETMTLGVVYQDMKGNINTVNPAAKRILGLSQDQMLGRTSLDPRWHAIHEDGSEFQGETHPSMVALHTGKEVKNVVMGVFHPIIEEYRWINIHAVPQFRPGEEVPYQVYTTFDDITDRIQADQAAHDTELKFKNIAESSPMGIHLYQLEKDGRLIFMEANPAADVILGVDSKQFVGKTIEEGFLPLVSTEIPEHFRQAYLKGEPWRTEQVNHEDGQIKGAYEIYAFQTAPNVMAILFLDITARVKSLEALKQSEERFRVMAENIREVFWLFDWKNQNIEYISPAYEQIWNRPVEKLYVDYKNWYASIYPDDLDHARESFAKIAKSGGGEICEYRILRPDGAVRWISDRGFAVKDKKGDVVRIAGITEDITERRQALEALRESEEKFRTVTEQSPNMIFINRQGRIVYANRKCEQVMGYSRDEFYAPDFDFMTLVAPEYSELIRSNFKGHMKGEEIKPYEYALISRDGQKIDVIITTKLINYDGERSILGIITDITERKEAEKALQTQDNKLERQAKNLEEVNTALKVLLEQREKEKTEIKETLLTNVKKLVFPYIEKLENTGMNEDAKTFVNIIKSNINDLISPLASNLSSKYFALTPSEIQIADLIKQGKTSKEIASMLNVSPKAVSFHRGNLRRKLGLLNKKINLGTYLQSFPH